QELCAATDFALRAMKVMSTVVVQEQHLWLTLAQMADVDKARFLDALVSQGGLFRDTFSAVQKQTEAIKHILPRRDSAITSPGPQPPPARRRGTRCEIGSSTSSWPRESGAARVSGTGQEHPQKSCEAGEGDCNFLTSGVPAPSSLLERRLASSDPDSELDIVSAGTREEDFSPGRSTFWEQLPHRGHVSQRSLDSPRDQAGSLASASQPLAVVDSDGTRPPRYRGVLSTTVHSDTQAAVLRAEVAVLLAKDAIEPVPPAEMKSGFYSPYFIVPKKSGGLRPILDLRALNRSLLRLPFKMLTTKRMLTCIRRQDWFAAIDLKDTYFHVSILPRHRPFLRFAFEGRAYQYKVLPFGLSLSPRVFTKVTEAALSPLWRMGIRILNYLDDWLLIAHSRDLLCEHRDLVLRHLSHLGLQVNREKSKLSPVQRISFLGVELDSVNMTAHLTNECAQLLGHMAAAAAVTPLGLLHMRLLQRWLHDRAQRWAWHRGTLRIGVSLQCRRLFSPPEHLAASGSWTGPQLQWHINCLELLAVLLALRRFRPMLRHKHVLVRTDSTATVAYINHQGGLRSRRMSQLARHLLLWSQTWLKSLRAIHIPGELNHAADQLSRQSTHPGEWRLHPQVVQLIWSHFGEAQIDLFASPESSHCQLFYSPRQGAPGTQLASGAQVRLSPSEPPCTDSVQDQGGRGAGSAGCAILAHPDLVSRPHFPHGSPSLEDPLEERPSFSGDGHNLAPAPRPMEPARLAPGRDVSDLSGLSQAVIETITQSRAPSTRQAYALRWGLFVDWCSSRGEDPQRCPTAVVLSFLQEKLECRLSPSTLKVYVAAITAYHDAVDGTSLGKHQLIVRFLRDRTSYPLGTSPPHLSHSHHAPDCAGLHQEGGGPTSLLCQRNVPGIRARRFSRHVPKVPTTPFRDQVVNLQALPLEEADPASALLCPVRALRIYVDRTRHFRCTEQLFVCFGGQQKGNAVSKQRLAHWVVDAISLSYQNQGEPCPLGVHAHSTRSVASSYALAHGASLADICRAAGWVTPNIFARFYNLRVEAV
ncbi:hypothetical protein M9458_043805, partial [Cirrhinus mrigala]